MSIDESRPKRGPGRPLGSKNKPKIGRPLGSKNKPKTADEEAMMIERRREKARVRMREIRKANPKYCQPKVNRVSIGYCPGCEKDMSWADARGDPAVEPLRCPVCDAVLERLIKTHRAGKYVMRRNTRSFCLKCKREDYWQQAKRRRVRRKRERDEDEKETKKAEPKDRLVCHVCGGELYTLSDQPMPGLMGGNIRSDMNGRVRNRTC